MSYVAQRLLTFPLILLGVSVVVFVSIRLIPGDAITAMLGTEAGLLTPAQRAALATYFGIDQPIWSQYLRWLGGLFQGDLGISTIYGKPVLTVILDRFPLTLELALLSMLIALCIGVPLGVLAATRNERPSDLVVRVLAMLGQSTPNFVIGVLIIYVLSVYFGVVPVMGIHALTVDRSPISAAVLPVPHARLLLRRLGHPHLAFAMLDAERRLCPRPAPSAPRSHARCGAPLCPARRSRWSRCRASNSAICSAGR